MPSKPANPTRPAMPDVPSTAQDLVNSAKDAAYVAVGLSIMGFQRAQVRRRELIALAKQAGQQLPNFEAPLADVRSELTRQVIEIDHRVEKLLGKVESSLAPVEERLPAAAQAAVKQAREARAQLREYLRAALAA